MARTAPRLDRDPGMMEDPPITRWLFNSTTAAWGWLAVRMYVGYQWVVAGEHKVADPAWMSTGEALKGFWVRASAIPAAPAKPVVSFDWYRDFLKFLLDAEAYTWFAKLVAVGELLIGIGLILGVFTGIAAFFGAFLNWNFMMAGTASTNPVLMVLAVGLMLAWKVAGYYGADRWILPYIGTPWHGGSLIRTGGDYVRVPDEVRTA
mgnify:FL=1